MSEWPPQLADFRLMSDEDIAAYHRDLLNFGRAYMRLDGERWVHVPLRDVYLPPQDATD